jgi:hypothetical protein
MIEEVETEEREKDRKEKPCKSHVDLDDCERDALFTISAHLALIDKLLAPLNSITRSGSSSWIEACKIEEDGGV